MLFLAERGFGLYLSQLWSGGSKSPDMVILIPFYTETVLVHSPDSKDL